MKDKSQRTRHGLKPEAGKIPASRGRKTQHGCLIFRRFDGGHFPASGFNPWLFFLLSFLLFSLPAQAADSPAQQIRTSYARLDSAYSRRDVPAIMAFLAPDFKRVTWNAALTPAQFRAELADDFDGMASAAATTRIKSLTIHGDRANAVVVHRLDWTYSQPMPEQPPPYFHVWVTQEQWRSVQGQWQMTEIADTLLVQTLSLLDSRDQGIRFRAVAGPKDPAIMAQMRQIDAADRVRLKQIIRQYGWPGFDLAGTDGEGDAWEIVQHSDDDKAFQKRCLPLIEAAVKRQQAMPSDAAYLTDRILVGEHKPQVYGTQGNAPIEDAAHVDERRAAVGLGPLEAYDAQLKQIYQPKP